MEGDETMNSYKIILMDADNTLFDFDAAERYALKMTFKESHLELTETMNRKYAEINQQLWDEVEQGTMTQGRLKVERFQRLFRELGIRRNSQAFSERYIVWLSRGTFLIPGAERLCRYLSRKYTLAILTNGITDVQIPRIQNSTIGKYFQHVIVSEEIAFSKPDVRFFQHAAQVLGAERKNDMLMIGDSLQSDILGGLNFGIDTCWLNNRFVRNRTEIQPKFEISRLDQLRTIL